MEIANYTMTLSLMYCILLQNIMLESVVALSVSLTYTGEKGHITKHIKLNN